MQCILGFSRIAGLVPVRLRQDMVRMEKVLKYLKIVEGSKDDV